MTIPASLTLPAIQQSIKDLWDAFQWLLTGQLDWKGRRLQKIGNAAVSDDALPLGQAKGLFMPLSADLGKLVQSAAPEIRIDVLANRGGAGAHKSKLFAASDRDFVTWISDGTAWRYVAGVWVDTFANRSTTSLVAADEGMLFYATDHLVYWKWDGTNWVYERGTALRTQANVAALAALLGANDVGYLLNVTDFVHLLRWTGAAFTWAPGDAGSGYIVAATSAPLGSWVVCDGAATNILTATGGVSSVTTPDLSTTGAYIRTGTPATTQTAASFPTWFAGSKTDNESAHTHAAGTLAADAASTGITVDAHTTAADTAVTGAGTRVTTATHTVNDPTHTHTVSGTSAAGSAHSHNLSDATAKMNKIGDATWVPQNIALAFYMRN